MCLMSIIIFEGIIVSRLRVLSWIMSVDSVLCASAPNLSIFDRSVAGISAAGLFQAALCIISLCVRLEKQPLYIGIVVSVFGIAFCLGPILGGVLTDRLSWRWCFWMCVILWAYTVDWSLNYRQQYTMRRTCLAGHRYHSQALGHQCGQKLIREREAKEYGSAWHNIIGRSHLLPTVSFTAGWAGTTLELFQNHQTLDWIGYFTASVWNYRMTAWRESDHTSPNPKATLDIDGS